MHPHEQYACRCADNPIHKSCSLKNRELIDRKDLKRTKNTTNKIVMSVEYQEYNDSQLHFQLSKNRSLRFELRYQDVRQRCSARRIQHFSCCFQRLK